jgi:hypothetical protein
MKRGLILAFAAVLSACAPTPVRMPAAQASELLNLFAAGRGPANVCSADGRALLRGAVRAYSAEMRRSGLSWPVVPGVSATEPVTHVDTSVMIAFAAGFVKADDFRGRPRLSEVALMQWPEIRSMRTAARQACEEVVALQQAAADFVLERSRYELMSQSVRKNQGAAERLHRQSARLQRAEDRMQLRAAEVHARMQQQQL